MDIGLVQSYIGLVLSYVAGSRMDVGLVLDYMGWRPSDTGLWQRDIAFGNTGFANGGSLAIFHS